MAVTNTPLATIEGFKAQIEYRKQCFGTFAVNGKHLVWLISDAEHLNKLNSLAMEMGYEDAEAALKALADYEVK